MTGTTESGDVAETSEAALTRYRHTMRRQRGIYYAILLVIVVGLGVVVGVAWSRGEVAHTSLRTVAAPPPSLALQQPARTLSRVWRSADRAAIGTPQYGGTVVTYSTHTVAGRDARTGARTWAYTRSDRTVCTAAQLSGVTIAIYKLHGNCDEVTALASGTGKRRWTRTLDMDGMPINGQPSYQTTPYTLLVTTPRVIYALDPVSGYNRWTYQRTGCRIEHAVLGSGGALISQNCAASVKCGSLKFCAAGQQVFLRDGMAGNGDDTKPNADQIKWLKQGDSAVPACADDVLGAIDANRRQIDVLDPDTGATTTTVPLHAAAPAGSPIASAALSGANLVWAAGRTYVVSEDPAAPHWNVATSSPPTVATSGDSPPSLTAARITVLNSKGIVELDGHTGQPTTYAIPAPPPGGLGYPLGAGFLVTSAAGTAVYS